MRYSRQDKFLEKIGIKNFSEILRKKRILLIGCGGTGSPIASLLIRSGLENLTIIDFDIVDETNLQRQLYREKDIGKMKVEALKEILLEISSSAKIKTISHLFDENSKNIMDEYDLIIDSSDNIETRRLIEKFANELKKTYLYTGAIRSESIIALITPNSNILEKLLPKNSKDEGCLDSGVLSSTTLTTASLALNEIILFFSGKSKQRIIKMNLLTLKIFEIKF